jgi:transcriptional regulator with XRE-family HTH domain
MDVLAEVAPRLKAARLQHAATLRAVSEATGISVSTLSRLESGQRRPSLELLLPLARTYGVALDDLVGAPETGDPRVRLKPVKRGRMTMVPLTRRPGGVQAFKVVLPPVAGEPALQTHEGYEWLYVLDGRLRLLLGAQDLPGAARVRRRGPAGGRAAGAVRPAGRAGAPARTAGW